MKVELRVAGVLLAVSALGLGLGGSPAGAGGPVIIEDMPGDTSGQSDEDRWDGEKECTDWDMILGGQSANDYEPGETPGGGAADPSGPNDPGDGSGGGGGPGYVGSEGEFLYDPTSGVGDPGPGDPTDAGPDGPTDTGPAGPTDTGPGGPIDTGGDTGDTGSQASSACPASSTPAKAGPSRKVQREAPQLSGLDTP